jgi:epoxide hydrolase 4
MSAVSPSPAGTISSGASPPVSGQDFDWGAFQHTHHPINGLSVHIATLGVDVAPHQSVSAQPRFQGNETRTRQPPILFLHGFPDLWCVWARVMHALEHEWACFAPDLRGYNLTSRPTDVAHYRPECLLDDIAGLVALAGQGGPVMLVGHDWGGVLAAWFAARNSALVDKLVLINTTHPVAFQHALWRDPAQRATSAYINAMRCGQAEADWLADGTQALFERWTDTSRRAGHLDAHEAQMYRAAWADPDAWRAMIDWYRASPFEVAEGPTGPDWTAGQSWIVNSPTLVLHGQDDAVFTPALRDMQAKWFSNFDLKTFPGVGHSPIREAPDRVVSAISLFLKQDWTNDVRD